MYHEIEIKFSILATLTRTLRAGRHSHRHGRFTCPIDWSRWIFIVICQFMHSIDTTWRSSPWNFLKYVYTYTRCWRDPIQSRVRVVNACSQPLPRPVFICANSVFEKHVCMYVRDDTKRKSNAHYAWTDKRRLKFIYPICRDRWISAYECSR